MPEGEYKFNKQFTAEQCEMDDIYGILENETRTISFTAPNFFKYTYHYYYEYENGFYVIVDSVKNDTVFSGTYVVDGNKIVATITGGEQVARDDVKQIDLACKEAITGSIVLEENGDKLRVGGFELNPKNIDRIGSIIAVGFGFKKVQPA